MSAEEQCRLLLGKLKSSQLEARVSQILVGILTLALGIYLAFSQGQRAAETDMRQQIQTAMQASKDERDAQNRATDAALAVIDVRLDRIEQSILSLKGPK